MVRDAVKPDLTMFVHYETLNENGRQIVAVDIQQGTERPYYIAKRGCVRKAFMSGRDIPRYRLLIQQSTE